MIESATPDLQIAEPKPHQHSMAERFLRQVWLHKEFDDARLTTLGGQRVTLLDLGEPNLDGGPDFRNARIRIGPMLFTGDIELHQFADDWTKHGHQQDPRFNSVILHVALWGGEGAATLETQAGRTLQTVLLHKIMKGSIPEALSRAVKYDEIWRAGPLPCASVNTGVDHGIKVNFLQQLADTRIHRKERVFSERASAQVSGDATAMKSNATWEQVLYEGVMDALGFSKNRAPFKTLAVGMPLAFLRTLPAGIDHVQSSLFGAAGLLADAKFTDAETGGFVTELQALWNAAQVSYTGARLGRSDWQWLRMRPQNFPPVRLAGAAVFANRIVNEGLFDRLTDVFSAAIPPEDARTALHELFDAPAEGYWKTHYDFGSAWSTPIVSLVGPSRVDDIIVNIVIPLMRSYAAAGGNETVATHALALWGRFRALGQNEFTERVERWLMSGKKLSGARAQQGAIELFTHYCRMERCLECGVGKKIAAGFKG